MEEEYNWNLINKIALPIAAAEAVIFYISIINFWKWVLLVIGIFLAAGLVYSKNRKKSNIFTACAIVFLAALLVRFLLIAGFIR